MHVSSANLTRDVRRNHARKQLTVFYVRVVWIVIRTLRTTTNTAEEVQLVAQIVAVLHHADYRNAHTPLLSK